MLIDDLPFEHGDFPKPAPSSVIQHGWEIPEPNGRDDFLSNVTDYQRLTHHLDPFGGSIWWIHLGHLLGRFVF
jgi:hypothetical protein